MDLIYWLTELIHYLYMIFLLLGGHNLQFWT